MLATLVLSAVAALPLQGASGTITGQVRSGASGEPIPYAVVEVVDGSVAPIRVESDRYGFYVLRAVPMGRQLVRASHIDHAPHEVEVRLVSGRPFPLDFSLELRPVRLPAVDARAGASEVAFRDTVATRPSDLGAAAVRVLEATPGVAELGLAEAAREVPGHEPLDPSDVLFVRGGTADLKLVLLNGAPVFAPFHIGGLINAIDTDIYRSATLHLGGAPARYDGGLSYVMDLETRTGRNKVVRGSLAVDMLAAKATVEGPVADGTSFLAAGRAVHGAGTEPFVAAPFPYSYGDGVARVDIELSARQVLSVSAFFNRETVQLDSLTRPGTRAEWGNTAGSVRLIGEMGGADGVLTLAFGEFGTRLPLGGLRVLLTEGVARHLRAGADFVRPVGPGRVNYGATFDRLEFEQSVRTRAELEDTTLFASNTDGNAAGVYVDATVNPLERLRVRAGLRADVFSLSPELRLAPRLSATLLLTDRVALTLAAGRYHQYVRTTDQPLALIATPLAAHAQKQQLGVASASHFTVALDQDLGEGIRLSLDAFYKAFAGLASPDGTAEASGVDLWVRRGKGHFTGWFGYSLAWIWSDEERRAGGTHLFAGRQLMTAGLTGPLIGKGAFDVRVAYGSGLPFAAIPEPEAGTPVIGVGFTDQPAFALAEPVPSLPAPPDEPYLRLDAQVARTWDAELRGFAFSVTPYFKVLNALDRRDGVFYYYDRGADASPRAVAGLPVLPIVGLDWRF